MKTIKITTPYIKLDQLLKFANLCDSGGAAKDIIQSGKVYVNNEKEIRRGRKIVDGDIIKIDHKTFVVRQDGVNNGDKKITSEKFPELH